MEALSIYDTKFINLGLEIINKKGQLLLLINYPYQAGNRDFVLLKSKTEFLEILEKRNSRDALTIFKTINILSKEILSKIQKPKSGDWLLLCPSEKYWNFFDNYEELKEELNNLIGKDFLLISEPDWHSKEDSLRAYKPDEDGIIRLGTY